VYYVGVSITLDTTLRYNGSLDIAKGHKRLAS
jgi:hypothetical protein